MAIRSIRTRLVASYMLVGLLGVAVAGVLAQSLVARVIEARQAAALRETAMTIALQAQPLLARAAAPVLEDLTRTSSFLADAQVTILGPAEQVLADSGPRAGADHVVFVAAPPVHAAPAVPVTGTLFMRHVRGVLGDHVALAPAPEAFVGGAALPDAAPPWPGAGVALRIVVDRGDERVAAARSTGLGGTAAANDVVVAAPPADPAAPAWHRLDPAAGQRREATAIQVPIGNPAAPAGYVRLRDTGDARAAALATTRRSFTLAALVAALVAGAFGVVVAGGVHAPLAELTAATARMSAGDLQARARVRGRDEIAQLGAQFNAMADALSGSFAALEAERDALRAFIADASHELRTPITALSNFNELLAGAAVDDAAARAEFVAESRRQLDRLRRLTAQLLDLSRLDAGLVALDRAPVDVGALLAEVAAAHAPAAAARGLTLEVRPPAVAEPCLAADRERLTAALSNLVDNAVKYAPASGRVTIGADVAVDAAGASLGLGAANAEATPTVTVWVEDSGAGIDPADADRIWERFTRGRRGTEGVDGTGLGLAIVQSTARAHGGWAAVVPAAGGGCRFAIALPGV